MTGNGLQLAGRFLNAIWIKLGTQLLTTTAYHSQTNVQKERFSLTIVDGLHQYVDEHQNEWDTYGQPMIYAYEARVQKSTKTTFFSPALTKDPPGEANVATPPFVTKTNDNSLLAIRRTIMTKIDSFKRAAKASMETAQAQYESSYDEHVKRQQQLSPGDLVFVGRPPTQGRAADNKPTHKLRPKSPSRIGWSMLSRMPSP